MQFLSWGEIDYELGVEKQLALLESVHSGESEEALVFCSHPPVVTLGRGSGDDELAGWQGAVVKCSRGGKATYHGPEQLVIYPILDLRKIDRPHLVARDVQAYLTSLSELIVLGLKRLDIVAVSRTTETLDRQGQKLSLTGIWIGEHKVCSIGIAVRKWITYHGAAINLHPDTQAFRGIRPCGFSQETMSSLQELTGRDILTEELVESLKFAAPQVF